MATKKAAPKKKAIIVEAVPAVEPAGESVRADAKLSMRIDQLGGQVESIRAHYADASTEARYAAAVRLRSIANILNDLTRGE